jgi:hypothetical protein
MGAVSETTHVSRVLRNHPDPAVYRNLLGAGRVKSLLGTSTCDSTILSKNVNASFVDFAWY